MNLTEIDLSSKLDFLHRCVEHITWILAVACCFFVNEACNHVLLKLWTPMPSWIFLTALIQGGTVLCFTTGKKMDWKIWIDSQQLPSFWVLPACLAILFSDHGHLMTSSRLDFNSCTCMHTLWIWWWFVQPASSTLSHFKKYIFEVKKVFNRVIYNKEGAELCA